MGKKAREKRGRREPAGPVRPERVRSPSVSQGRPADPPGRIGWPHWAEHGGAVDWPWLALVAGVALAVRGSLLITVIATPYLEVDNIDAKGYQLWAQQILDGGWWPRQHFYQSPLYAYYLAVVQTLCGPSPWPPRVIQVLLGSVSVLLLGVVGTVLFNRRIGLLAAAMLALYGPMILEEITLSKTSLLIFGALLGFLLFLRARDRRSRLGMAAAGLVFGGTIIGVGQWLIALLGLAVLAALDRATPRALRPQLAILFLAGALVTLGPIIAWNSYAGGGFILTSGDAGLNLYLGNNPMATALTGRPKGLRDVPQFEESDSRRLAEGDVGHSLTPAEVSRHWTGAAIGWAIGHPAAFVGNTLRKVVVLANSYEIPDSYHFAFVREHYLPSLWGSLSLAIVGPLALVGLVVAAWHRPARPLYVICLCYLGVLALFYVRSRYRLPAVPFLMIFAAAAVDWAVRTVERRAWSAAAGMIGAFLLAAIFVNHTYCEPARPDIPAICFGGDAWFDLEWQKLAEWEEQRGNLDAALVFLHRAAETTSIRGPGGLHFWIGKDELQVAQRAVVAGDHGNATRHLSAAAEALERALQRSYRVAESQTLLATVYQLQARRDQAAAASDAAVRARPNDPAVLSAALRLQTALGRCEAAVRLRGELHRVGADDPQADQLVADCRTIHPPQPEP